MSKKFLKSAVIYWMVGVIALIMKQPIWSLLSVFVAGFMLYGFCLITASDWSLKVGKRLLHAWDLSKSLLPEGATLESVRLTGEKLDIIATVRLPAVPVIVECECAFDFDLSSP